jgi:hypothetical protein
LCWLVKVKLFNIFFGYWNNDLFYFPEAYRRLENIVRAYPADKFNLLDTNTEFLIKDYCPHKHTNLIHQPLLLHQGLSISLAKGLGT